MERWLSYFLTMTHYMESTFAQKLRIHTYLYNWEKFHKTIVIPTAYDVLWYFQWCIYMYFLSSSRLPKFISQPTTGHFRKY